MQMVWLATSLRWAWPSFLLKRLRGVSSYLTPSHQRQASARAGFTLIELLLYVGLIGILLGAVTIFFSTAADARLKTQTITEVDEQGTYAMDYIAQTVRNATSISSPTAGNSSSTGFTMVVPTGSLSPTVFSIASGVLQVQQGAGATVALTDSKVQVSSLTVTNLTRSGTSGILQIILTLARINPSNLTQYDYQRTFTTSVAVRP